MFREKILISTDLSPASYAAVDKGAVLARQVGASVLLLYIYDPALLSPLFMLPGGAALAPAEDRIRSFEQGILSELRQLQTDRLTGIRQVELLIRQHPNAADGICTTAREQKAELLVLGTHGRTGLDRAFLGSVAERVVRHASCPVLTVRSEPE